MIFTVPDPHNPHNPPIAEGDLEQIARLLEPGQYKAVANGEPVTISLATSTRTSCWVDRLEPDNRAWPTEDLYHGYTVDRSAW